MDKISVIITHWGMNYERSMLMRVSLQSLFNASWEDIEVIVIDNGGNDEDSAWLLEQNMKGNIAVYIRNRKNMSFGYGRNQGLRLASGDFVVIADNDIYYQHGWDVDCANWLNRNPGKYLATPIKADPMNRRAVRWQGEQDGWKLNTRAGSNVFMMRREDAQTIGEFDIHRIAGSLYCDRFCKLGYVVAVMPEPKAIDMGIRRGYNIKSYLPHTTL